MTGDRLGSHDLQEKAGVMFIPDDSVSGPGLRVRRGFAGAGKFEVLNVISWGPIESRTFDSAPKLRSRRGVKD